MFFSNNSCFGQGWWTLRALTARPADGLFRADMGLALAIHCGIAALVVIVSRRMGRRGVDLLPRIGPFPPGNEECCV